MSDQNGGILPRTFGRLSRRWRDWGRDRGGVDVSPGLPDGDLPKLRRQIDAALAHEGGAVSARNRAGEIGRAYLGLDPAGRARFLGMLASEYGPDAGAIDAAVSAWRESANGTGREDAEAALRRALESPRLQLMRQFNALPEGVKFLVDMRAEVLKLAVEDPSLKPLEHDLKDLLSSWFDIGFLNLQRIGWDAPAKLLEKLIAYEAVHEIRDWRDLKNRLESDRRCYAFFHPRMPDEPLIFVEVALVDGIADSIQALLDENGNGEARPGEPDTAIFYSISNAQAGLAGVSFGDFLIKRVVDDLSHLPGLKTFATLSPVPGFGAWLRRRTDRDGGLDLTPHETRSLEKYLRDNSSIEAIVEIVLGVNWWRDQDLADALRPPLVRWCARYLLEEQRSPAKPGLAPTAHDRVAHFHLTNGARLERINWLADTSARGLRQSAGIMVNYLYDLKSIARNHESYRGKGKIAASPAVRGLLKA